MRSATHFAPEASTVGAARRFVGATLASWGLEEGDALLLTSELATNAVRHARTPYEVVVSRVDGSGFRVAVVDDDPSPPVSDLLGTDDGLGGRGILLVVSLARRWGCDRQGTGKVVWFEL